jgi:hypothetical protein
MNALELIPFASFAVALIGCGWLAVVSKKRRGRP